MTLNFWRPYRAFVKFRYSVSRDQRYWITLNFVDRRILRHHSCQMFGRARSSCFSETSMDISWSSKFVKCPVGLLIRHQEILKVTEFLILLITPNVFAHRNGSYSRQLSQKAHLKESAAFLNISLGMLLEQISWHLNILQDVLNNQGGPAAQFSASRAAPSRLRDTDQTLPAQSQLASRVSPPRWWSGACPRCRWGLVRPARRRPLGSPRSRPSCPPRWNGATGRF